MVQKSATPERPFLPMVHRYEKCNDNLKVASGGTAEIEYICEKSQAFTGFRFAISPPPTDATLKMSLHFLHLWKIGQKGFLLDFEKMVSLLNYRPECPEVVDFCCFCIINIKYP